MGRRLPTHHLAHLRQVAARGALGLGERRDSAAHRNPARRDQALLATNPADLGADYVADYDAAVRDTTIPNNLQAQYLTNGVPNGAYHNQLAQYLADAVNDFPPRAEL
ncbi:hypothetical protein FHS29_000942 [Saccharothrix tamanrassetensis]|uniref:Uncharacterized protein n=1 Tax=Saccharothrix tamanrassetensis TaxID=1051531 RepID=A0A841C784_9PSEU|nr:hypothetical protein [Saccharothrix tamanrassetensis]MBB5954372.1 hypothetical protein [Saccharothrix tamanrassetensis]